MENTRSDCESMKLFRERLHRVAVICFSGESWKAKQKGLTVTQASLLRLMATDEKLKMSDLALRMSVTLGRVTRVTQELFEKGLLELERDASDRRSVIASLTRKGILTHDELIDLDMELCAKTFHCISSGELEPYISCLDGLYEALIKALKSETV